jgi:hypothetical protein
VKTIDRMVAQMRENPKDVKYKDLCNVCDYFFGESRTKGSHRIYKTPWPGDPRINIQDDNGEAKVYQVRQVLSAIDRLGGRNG